MATMRWFRDNHAQFVPADVSFPAYWLMIDGSYFELTTVEACESLEAVKTLVLGVAA